MNKALMNLAVKAGKTIVALISAQIINYLSSEEFTNRVKSFIEEMVKRLVSLVQDEQSLPEKNE